MVATTEKTLGKVTTFLNGGTPSTEHESYFNGDIPWITGTDISDFRVSRARSFITEDAIRRSATSLVPKGTPLLVTRTSVGKVAITPTELCFSQDITAIIPDVQYLDANYLIYFLSTKESHFKRHQRGATIQGITREVVADIEIRLPSVVEQKRIAAILDKADRLRRQRRFAQTLSDSFLQSVFIKMFGDPAMNPKEWTINPVDDVLSKKRATRTGPFGSSLKRHEYVESGIPVWQINNLRPNEFVEANPLFITEKKYASLKNYSVEKGDILISRAGTVGRMCVATSSIQPSIIGTNLVRVVLDTDKVLPVYFSSLFTYFPGRVGNLRMSGDDGAYSFLNPGTLRTIPIPVPPLPIQEKFAAIVQKFERIRRKQREATRQAEHLFQTLLHRAFRGEI